MSVKITDLVDQETIDRIAELNGKIQEALASYQTAARDMAKGLEIDVKVAGDFDRIEQLLVSKTKEAVAAQERLNSVIASQRELIGQTTPVISRNLMEKGRLNKLMREEYADGTKVKEMLSEVVESYDSNTRILAKLDLQIKANKESQKSLEAQFKKNLITEDAYIERQSKLIAVGRDLAQQKSNLQSVMKIEEKMNLETESSYNHLSHQLELLKKTYKDLSAAQKETETGAAMEKAIQDLDAHLKDLGADMGEFQRNVGNYAIAGQNGVVATESLMAVLEREAVTMQDVADQTKILEEGKRMLNTSDEHYAETLAAINAQIEANGKRLADVSDIIGVQAANAAEAEAQNKRLKEALKLVDQSSGDATETIKELNDKIAENDKVIEAASGRQTTLKTDLKELVLQIATLSIEYQKLSAEEQETAEGKALAEHIRELTEEAGVLKDAIADTNAAITNAASDTRGFDQLAGSIQLAIDGFGLAEGAAAMLGLSTEDLAEIQTKLQAAIAASNAMQSIQNTLQSQSAVMQGVALVQTRLRTTAENLHTRAKGKGTVATAALTAAQWAFNAAANANPIGLLVVAITAAIGVVWGLVKAFGALFGPSEDAVKSYERQKEVLGELCDVNDRLIKRMKARGATETELLAQSLKNKQMEKEAAELLFGTAEKLYKNDSDEYKEALEAKKKAEEEYSAKVEDSVNYLMKIKLQVDARERENAIGTLAYKIEIIEKEKEEQLKLAKILYETGKITRQIYKDIVASVNKAAEFKIKDLNEAEQKKSKPTAGGPDPVKEAQKRAEELKKAVQAGEDALLLVISDSLERQREAELLSYARRLKDLQEQLARTKDSQVLLRTAIHRQIEGLEAEHQRKMAEIQYSERERHLSVESDFIQSHLAIAKEGSEEELTWKLKSLDNQMNSELLAIAKAEEEKTLTVEMAEEMRANIVQKYADLQQKAIEDNASAQAQKIMDVYAGEEVKRSEEYSNAVNDLKQRYVEELKAAKGNAAEQERLRKKLDDDLYKLDEEYCQNSLRATIKMIEDILNIEELSADERLKYERELTKAKIALMEQVTDAAKREAEEQMKDENDWQDENLRKIAKWVGYAQEAMDKVSSLHSALCEGRIQKIDEELEANTEAGDKEQERITELVSKKVITEEEGEARKRAAAVQTQRKEEELQKKKQQLQYKQAVWEKANTVAQIAISTGLAVMNASQTQPFMPLGIAMMAIAGTMGAIQLATALATPIPKYFKGTDHHKGGPAIVGDGGRPEVVLYRGDAWVTPDRPTLVDLPEGSKVIPDIKAYDVSTLNLLSVAPKPEAPSVIVNNDYSELRQEMREVAMLIRQQTREQRRIAYDQQFEIFKKRIL